MKWPEVVRWAGRAAERQREDEALPPRLQILEEIASHAPDLERWQELARLNLRLDPAATSWLRDADLLATRATAQEFFALASSGVPAGGWLWPSLD
jgi:hypothetical protein